MQSNFDPAQPPLINAAVALRKLSQAASPPLAIVRRLADERLLAVVDVAGRKVRTTRPLEGLTDELASGAAEFGVLDRSGLPTPGPGGVRLSDDSYTRFCWVVGSRLGRESGLAPWLEAVSTFRLATEPAYAELGASEADARALCQVIATRALSVTAIVDSAQLAQRTVFEVINALSLSGLLATEKLARPRAAKPKLIPVEGEPPKKKNPLDRILFRVRGG